MTKRFPLYPFLIISFHVLFLFFHNANILEPRALIVPFFGANFFILLIFITSHFLIRNRHKAGLITLFLVLFFLYYGHLHKAMASIGLRADVFAISFSLLILALLSFLIIKSRREFIELTRLLNICTLFLVLIPVATGFGGLSWKKFKPDIQGVDIVNPERIKNRPNFFYIVLDAYARDDILKEYYNYNNSEFLNRLNEYGFYVAHKSNAGYPQTHLSMASTLNLSYLDFLFKSEAGQELLYTDNRKPLRHLISDSKVFKTLEHLGYKFISFDSGYTATDKIESANIQLSPGKSILNEFYYLLARNTFLSMIIKKTGSYEEGVTHRRRVLYILDELAGLAKSRGPIFVFAHIISPHPPFVFGENGEKVGPRGAGFGKGFADDEVIFPDKNEYRKNYLKQLIFINKKVTAVIQQLLSESRTPPIIILQSDHGPASMLNWNRPPGCSALKERFANLNAIYMPGADQEILYDSITPVNTFRVIFNQYFGTDYELLDEKNYYSTWKKPYIFKDVTEELKRCASGED